MIKRMIVKLNPELDGQMKVTSVIIMCFAASILSYLSILDKAGRFGALIGAMILVLFGRAAFLLPFSLFFGAVLLIRLQKYPELKQDVNPRLVWGIFLLLGSFTGLLSLFFRVTSPVNMDLGGGLIGYIFYPFVLGNFGPIGGGILLFSIGLFGFFLISQLTFANFVDKIGNAVKNPEGLWDLVPDLFEVWRVEKNEVAPEPVLAHAVRKIKASTTKGDAGGIVAQTEDAVVVQPGFVEKVTLESLKARDSEIIWRLPPFDILKENHSHSEAGDTDSNKEIIQKTLQSFGIEVEMGDVVVGPTVSQYTFKPASGVKLSLIDGLQRDLALALAASSMRLEAPIAGKSLVGVQIPNKVKSQVRLRDIIQTKSFVDFDQDLPIAIGLDVAGSNLIYSLTKMPHLLVAGATGSGKSVWINSMLLSLLYCYTPQELQLVLVDMKRVELKLYEGVPHLIAPVITEAEKAINALKWTVLEMDRRYKLLEEFGKRNIKDYNTFVEKSSVEGLETLSYIVFVIDELGDLMMLAKSEVEPIIVRLTQMSRAVGIHLVLGTQRPDTHVVTGLIKANVPSRIAFAVASQIDSRVIMDQNGAEKLLGQGDGLFVSPSTIQPIRFQGPNVEEIEVRKCVDFLKDQAEQNHLASNLNLSVLEPPKTKISVPGMTMSRDDDEEGGDDAYEAARSFVIRTGKASTSLLQTALGFGYPKARKIIDQLEAEGVVGPANGSKPRDVYLTEE